MAVLHEIFASSDPAVVRASLRRSFGALIDEMGVELDEALKGSPAATYAYVASFRALTLHVVDAALAEEATPQVASNALGLSGLFEGEAANAPMAPWAAWSGRGDAAALSITSKVRHLVLGMPELAEPAGWTLDRSVMASPSGEALMQFRRQVFLCLAVPAAEHPLQRIRRVFDLSKSELGRLFGVKRQAIDSWLTTKVPAERQEKVVALLALADLLERKLKADRIPGVARRPADAYGGETMLTMIAADRHGELLDRTRDSFTWSRAA